MKIQNNRIIQIIKMLYRADKMISSETICQDLNITSRTLRNDLKSYKEILKENGIDIISKHGVGYKLEIIDETKYYSFIEKVLKDESQNQLLIPMYPEDRVNYLIRRFLTQEAYIKIDSLCDEIFVSRATLSNDLKEVRERLKYFRLEIESKPSYGLQLLGDEFHKRSCIAQYFFHTEGNDDFQLSKIKNSSTKQKEISMILYEIMAEKSFKLTDIGFQNLVIHIMIALLRLQENTVVKEISYDHQIYDTKEYQMAGLLCQRLEEKYQIIFPEIERYYIALHLSGKKAMQYTTNSLLLDEKNNDLLKKIFIDIKDKYDMDLSMDIELYTSLSLHFQPMLNRLKYGMPIQNPLLEQIKQENIIAFEISILVAKTIEKMFGYQVSENEMGYVALHFALAIERYTNMESKKNIIIICASGMGSSQILLHKVKQHFKDNIQSIYVTELYELESINQKNYDFILSTVPIPFETEIPAIHVQYFLDEQDIFQVSEAFLKQTTTMDFVDEYFDEQLFFKDIKSKNKEAIIKEMCQRIKGVKAIPDDFERLILEREHYSVTEFGNAIAMPHPMRPIFDETFVAVGILPKAIKWHKQKVKYVFLLSIKKDTKEALGLFHETLSALVFDKQALHILEQNPTLETLKVILKDIANYQKENDIDVIFD